MLKYLTHRIVQLVPVALGVSALVFFGMHLVPGDPVQVLMGEQGSEADLKRLRHLFGLDQPIYIQYLQFLARAVHGDFGVSLRTGQAAMRAIAQALPITIELSLAALLFAVVLGFVVGILAARYPRSIVDIGTMIWVLIGVSMPVFWTGLLLLIIFGGTLGWLPLGSVLDEGMTFHRVTGMPVLDGLLNGSGAVVRSSLRHLILPAVTLGTTSMATIARMVRSSVLEVLNLDFVRTARAKGVAERSVLSHHVLRNALLSVVTLIGLQLGLLLSGAVITETIFALPGVGRLAVTSVQARDYPVVQGVVIIAAAIFVLVNLLVDILYAYLDPRIRYG